MEEINHNNEKIIFSIVVCTFNREKHITRCLESLVGLDFSRSKFEIIVVDDGSTDTTVEIVEKYPVKLIRHEKNQGIAAARNTGLKAAKGEIYVCLDDDCYVRRDWLHNLSEAYRKYGNENIAGVAGLIQSLGKVGIIERYMDETGYANPSPIYYGRSKNPLKSFFAYLKNMFSPSIQNINEVMEAAEIWGANCSFPIEILRAVQGWDTNLSGVEDTDLCDRIKKKFKDKKFIYVKDAIMYHDHRLTLYKLFEKPYGRGFANLKFYFKNSKFPPIFPFPVAILLLTILFSIHNLLYLVPSLIILPQIFYCWWIIKAIKKRKLHNLIFPYLQSGYELSSILGILRGFVKMNLNITTRKLLILLLIFGISVNIFLLKNINVFYLRETLSSLYLLVLPGLLVTWLTKTKYRNFWELLAFIVGISLVTLMLLGLGINYLIPSLHIPSMQIALSNLPYLHLQSIHIPFIHITKPLSSQPILVSVDILLASLWVYVFVNNNSIPIEKNGFHFSIKNILLAFIPMVFPILSILGAISLNNNQTNILTMIMIGLIASYVLLLTFLRDKVSEHLFIFSLLMISLALLFMTSLRGWYITGHDINLEYFVFQLTKTKGIWKMSNFQDPYTACLSITILPTIFSTITHINDLYIYKALYQIVFSISIVATYLFLRKFIGPFLAFLGSFAIVSLPTFMTDMPMLNRQEIALLFFVLLLNTLFNKNFSKKIKWFMFVFLGLGLLFSHYSTTYVALGLFIGAFLLHLVLRLLKFHPEINTLMQKIDNKLGLLDSKPNLHFGMVAILLIATVIWNVSITNTAGGITNTLVNITKDLKTAHIAKTKSGPASYSLLSGKVPNRQSLLDNYVDTTTKYYRKFNFDSAFISKDIFSQYHVVLGSQVTLPLTVLGKKLTKLHVSVFSLNDQLKQAYAKLIQIFIIIGFVAIFFLKKHISNFEKEYLVFTITFFVILIVQVVLPGGSIDYGILRLFQQGLILFSIPLLMGGLAIFSIFNFIHKSIKIYLLSFFLIFFFLYLSGFLPMLTGGYYPQLNLSNAGFYYDAYYTHTQDISAMNWLSANYDKKTPIQSDWFALKKIHTYEKIYSVDGLIPSVIRRNSYVYLSVSNVQTGQVIIYANGAPLYYKYPFNFLDSNKNLIYSNGSAKIYR